MKAFKKMTLIFLAVICAMTFVACGNKAVLTEVTAMELKDWWNMPSDYVGPRTPLLKGAAEQQYYVATTGDDNASGGIDAPFASLAKAQEAVRQSLVSGKKCIEVILRGGEHVLSETLIMDMRDSSADGRVTYKAYQNEEVYINSDQTISGWRAYADGDNAHVPEALRDNIWVATVPECIGERPIRTLYKGRERLRRSTSKGFLPTNIENSVHDAAAAHKYRTVQFPDEIIKDWDNVTDVELSFVSTAAWAHFIIPIAGVDEAGKTATLQYNSLYVLGKPNSNVVHTETMFVENATEYISDEGDWAVDTTDGKIYYYSMTAPTDIRYPKLQEFIKIEGDIDFGGAIDIPVKNITLEGLRFEHGERYDLYDDFGKDSLQHSWELYDSNTAMVRTRGVDGFELKDCSFANSGGSGFRADLHFTNSVITGNQFSKLGAVGILVAGYGPGTKDASRYNTITNNHIYRTGELYKHGIGIFINQSGYNHVANNSLSTLPYIGIAVSNRALPVSREGSATVRSDYDSTKPREIFLHGRNNIIENNDISDVTRSIADGNAIYISGAGLKNIVRYNYVHNMFSNFMCEALRCDDYQDGSAFYNNIVTQLGGYGIAICSKGMNDIVSNIIHIPDSMELVYRGIMFFATNEITGSQIKGNVFYVHGAVHEAYQVSDASAGATVVLPELSQAMLEYNTYFSVDDADWGEIQKTSAMIETGGEEFGSSQNPLFYDADNEDYRLLPDSPVKGLVEELDLSKVGVHSDFMYTDQEDAVRAIYVTLNGMFTLPKLAKSDKNSEFAVWARTEKGYILPISGDKINFSSVNGCLEIADHGGIRAKKNGREQVILSMKENPEIKTSIYVDIV